MPRAYNTERRQAAAELTRTRVLEAARELLQAPEEFGRFTVEAVAQQANVARMTVYYQFGSRSGLLEALCDYMGRRGGMERLGAVFQIPDPLEALGEYVRLFAQFWASDRVVTRRLRALAALDPEFEAVIRTRDGWRRGAIQRLVQMVGEKYGKPAPEARETAVIVLLTLCSFATYDELAGSGHTPDEVAVVVTRLAYQALGFDASPAAFPHWTAPVQSAVSGGPPNVRPGASAGPCHSRPSGGSPGPGSDT